MYTCGRLAASRPRTATSPTTPTTVNWMIWPPLWLIWRPSGSCPGHSRWASDWLMTTTFGAFESSRSATSRPLRRGMPSVEK